MNAQRGSPAYKRALVLEFQRDHVNHLGKPLAQDGDLGPQTQWAMDVETLCPGRRAIIAEAQKYLGLAEDPPRSNSDPTGTLERWLKECHARPGDAWCASGLSAWLGAAVPVKIAGAQNLGRHFPVTNTPRAGDIGWFPTDSKGHGHCFLIIGVSFSELMTIEGNLDNAVRCVRRRRPGVRFARTLDDVSGICPAVVASVPPAPEGTR